MKKLYMIAWEAGGEEKPKSEAPANPMDALLGRCNHENEKATAVSATSFAEAIRAFELSHPATPCTIKSIVAMKYEFIDAAECVPA